MTKRVSLITFFLLVLGLSTLVWYQAQAANPPKTFCGDGKIQSPNSDGLYEKCDDQGDSSKCTASCGQKMLGWAWSYNFGWLSLNNKSCDFLDPIVPAGICGQSDITYYVQIDASNQVKGFAWSNNLGWICFGATCNSDTNQTDNICQFASSQGLPCNANDYGIQTPPGGAWQAYIQNALTDNPPVLGWAKIISLGDDGIISLSCSTCTYNYQTNLILKDFKSGSSVEQRLTLKGWAWNDNSQGNGLGWIEFNPEILAASPWLQTKYGDVYSRGGLQAIQEAPDYNATYQILAGGDIVNFRSARLLVDPYSGFINFPTAATRYSNVLGKLDVGSLLCSIPSGNTSCINQYGNTVVKLNPLSQLPPEILAGKIYYYDGSVDISQLLAFKNGTNFVNGSGTIIVNGNLTINNNLVYFCDEAGNTNDPVCTSNKFRNLASIAWIVKGDLLVGPNVDKLAGNFVIIGDGKDCNADQNVKVNYCGQIYSCYNGADCSKRLTVSGLMMAKKFYFSRTYVSPPQEIPAQGSEVINYDGRLLANTPPGLGNFVQALPIWRTGTLSQ